MYKKTKMILRDFKKIVNPQNRTIGSVLKHFRKEQELTLETVAKDICSLSYLCKVERDQLVPSEEKLEQLMQRLGIKKEDINPNEKDTSYINKIIISKKVDNNIQQEYLNRYDYQAKIVRFAYYLFNEVDLKKAHQYKFEIIDYYFNFNKIEMEFVIYLIIYDAFLRENYQKVVKLFKEFKKINKDKNILINTIVILIQSLFKLERINDLKITMAEYIGMFYKYNRLEEIKLLKMIELTIMAKIGSLEDLEHELSLVIDNDAININFLWFNYYFFNEINYKKALIYINKIKDIKEEYYLYYLITLEKNLSIDLLILNLKSPLYSFSELSHQIVFNLLKCQYVDRENLNEINEFLYIDHLTGNHYVLNYVYKTLLEEAKNQHLYKRSCEILEKKNRILKEKASIIYNG